MILQMILIIAEKYILSYSWLELFLFETIPASCSELRITIERFKGKANNSLEPLLVPRIKLFLFINGYNSGDWVLEIPLKQIIRGIPK